MSKIEDKAQFMETVWREQATSEFAWERRALNDIRGGLTPVPPLGVWTGFEFMALDGATFEGDALVFNAQGAWLLRLLDLRGWLDPGRWSWVHVGDDQRRRVIDNPLRATQEAADRLHALLKEQIKNAGAPPVTALVVLTEPELRIEGGVQPERVVAAPRGPAALPSLLDALNHGRGPGLTPREKLYNLDALKRFVRAVDGAELEGTGKYRRVGDWRLKRLLETSASHQDYEAAHARSDKRARARVFFAPRDAAGQRQERLMLAAKREFRALESLVHPGVLRVERLLDVKSRPTLLFEDVPGAERLDHYLASDPDLSAAQRLDLLRQLAETVLYAHRKQIIHRALGPQSVLVSLDAARAPTGVKIMNWQTSAQADHLTSATRHVQDYLTAEVHLAPEHAAAPNERTDVFGLGVLGYALLTGRAPSPHTGRSFFSTLTMKGLRLSAAIDGVHPALESLILRATHPLARERHASVAAFVEALEDARHRAFGADVEEERGVDPLEASAGDVLDGRFEVIRRLGAGASAVALLVRDTQEGREVVLKVALDATQEDRLRAEGRTLDKIDHPQVVKYHGVVEVGGRLALTLRFVGKTLRERLSEEGRLSLDDLLRFGEDLCEVVVALEALRVFHRDIKPENLGVGAGHRKLTIFDFSLADAALEAVRVGTHVYRDPFVELRGRWDEHADRYAAAVTLYEMASDAMPVWGDGVSPPAIDPEATLHLESVRFPSAVRTELTAFFTRALARDAADRFHHGQEMLAAWRQLAERATTTDHGDSQAGVGLATPQTPLASLGLSDAAADALDRRNIMVVADLLAQPPQSFYFLRGTGALVRDELTRLHAALSARLGAAAPARPSQPEAGDAATWSLDQVMERLLASLDAAGADAAQRGLIMAALGLDEDTALPPWAGRADIAVALEKPPAEVAQAMQDAAAVWCKDSQVTSLRDDVVTLVERAEGVMAGEALALALANLRGSLGADADQRRRLSVAAARAAVMAEGAADRPRLGVARREQRVFVASRPALLDVLADLGAMADLLAEEDPLRSPAQAYEELAGELLKAGLTPMSRARLCALAVLASERAALSSRQEIYPRGMDAARALKLASGVLVSGGAPLGEDDLRQRVSARYPEARPLPSGIELEQLLREAGVPLEREVGASGFVSIHPGARSASHGLSAWTSAGPIDGVDRVRDKFQYFLRYGGFLALLVPPRLAEDAARALSARHPELEVRSLDALWIDAMDTVIDEFGVQWDTVLSADSPVASEQDRQLFEQHFLQAAVVPRVRRALLDAPPGRRVMLTHPGLMARYRAQGAMDVLEALRSRAGTPDGPHAVLMILPADQQHEGPTIDGAVVPVIGPSEWLRAPRAWLNSLVESPR